MSPEDGLGRLVQMGVGIEGRKWALYDYLPWKKTRGELGRW